MRRLFSLATAVLFSVLGGAACDRSVVAPVEAAADAPSVAVLPFVNMSSQTENDYFVDGLTEELIHQLARVEGLQVASRSASFAFKGSHSDPRTVGEALGVGALLEGSVRRARDRIRISALLTDAERGSALWSATYDRTLDDVFAIQDDIAGEVARSLGLALLPAEPMDAASAPL
jgi:adenylate cyclase